MLECYWIHRNKLQWNFNHNSWIFIQENAFENITCKMAAVLYWPQLASTYLPLVPHICVGELGQPYFKYWLVACLAPSHYLNQCWVIVNGTLRNKLQWNFNQSSWIFIHRNAFEDIICKIAAILSQPKYVKDVLQICLILSKAAAVSLLITFGISCLC